MDEKTLEILYDHYKETNQLRLEAQKRRNLSFVVSCILEASSFFFLIKPETMLSVFQNIIQERLGIVVSIGNNVFQTLTWLLLTFFLIRYIQDTMYIERQYKYQEEIEEHLNESTTLECFGREGKNYAANYPNSLNLIELFYKTFSPFLFVSVNVYRIIVEMRNICFSTIIDLFLCICIIIILWAYFFDVHHKISEWCRKRLPGFAKIADGIRKQLKKV